MMNCRSMLPLMEEAGTRSDEMRLPDCWMSIRQLRRLMSLVIERECGEAPFNATPGSVARSAYDAACKFLIGGVEVSRFRCESIVDGSDISTLALLAAYRGCWAVLSGVDAEHARRRGQIRCILAGTPGFALWRSAISSDATTRGGRVWVGGRSIWRDELRSVVSQIPSSCLPTTDPLIVAKSLGFSATRDKVLAILERTQAPVYLESLVASVTAYGPH